MQTPYEPLLSLSLSLTSLPEAAPLEDKPRAACCTDSEETCEDAPCDLEQPKVREKPKRKPHSRLQKGKPEITLSYRQYTLLQKRTQERRSLPRAEPPDGKAKRCVPE